MLLEWTESVDFGDESSYWNLEGGWLVYWNEQLNMKSNLFANLIRESNGEPKMKSNTGAFVDTCR